MFAHRLIVPLAASALALLPPATLAPGGGPGCELARAAPAETDFDAEIFFAVLEGLYRDGVRSEVAASVIERDPQSCYPLNFVQGCEICTPALDAFRTYLTRPGFSSKVPRDTFGAGLAEDENARLTSADGAVRRAALQAQVERWMQARMQLLRLDQGERALWNQALQERSKRGMAMLEDLKRSGIADYADFETCPLCKGAGDAASR